LVGSGGRGRQRRRRVTVLTEPAPAFRGVLGTKVVILDAADPEAKGLVERANGDLETSFLPGRRFSDPADCNAQLGDWLQLANQRHRRALGCACGADRRRPRRDAGAATGRAGDRVAGRAAAAARPLRAPGRQRRLGRPVGDRPPCRGSADLDRVQVSATDAWWPTTGAAGPDTRRSPILTTPAPQHGYALHTPASPAASRPRSSCAA
jgi:hypothetical protein